MASPQGKLFSYATKLSSPFINTASSPPNGKMGLRGTPPYPCVFSSANLVPLIPPFCSAQSPAETIDWSLIASTRSVAEPARPDLVSSKRRRQDFWERSEELVRCGGASGRGAG